MNDEQIEKEIQEKGLTAPRVTLQRIEEVIAGEYFFTAAQGIALVTQTASSHLPQSLKTLTFCVLVLKNGFTVSGEPACASPENFDAALGRKIARQKALDKIGMLEGYLLKQQLHERALLAQGTVPISLIGDGRAAPSSETFFTRLIREREELHQKIVKLKVFISGDAFKAIPTHQQDLLHEQYDVMVNYRNVLDARITSLPQEKQGFSPIGEGPAGVTG